MRLARFSTGDVPKELRFAAWHEMTSTALISTSITTDCVNDFGASVSLVDLGTVQLSTVSYPPLRAARSTRQIRESNPDLYYLTVPTRGALTVGHVEREADVKAGHFIMIDTSLPGVVANREPVEQLMIQVPRAELPIRSATAQATLGRSLPLGDGLGALMMTMARQIMGSADRYAPADDNRVAALLVDLVAAVLAQFVRDNGATRDAQQRLLQLRIVDFIDRRLADPSLSPSSVAAAHNVSMRYLQLLFHGQGLTVAGWIRDRRLDRCRRDLRDATLARRTVSAVGARWGFPHATVFSRAFKQAFGMPPGEYRQRYMPH